jgi:ribose 5-phosphate isomerase B
MEKMKIYIGSDHAGYKLKKKIIEKFSEEVDFEDVGTYSEESCDYPDFGKKVGEAVANNQRSRGIVICGTGIGISIAANKVQGIRAALCYNQLAAELSRRHNDANVLGLGARLLGEELAYAIVNTWLKTPFEGGRHQRRVNKLG